MCATAATFAPAHPIRFVRATVDPETHSVTVEWDPGEFPEDMMSVLYLPTGAAVRVPTGKAAH